LRKVLVLAATLVAIALPSTVAAKPTAWNVVATPTKTCGAGYVHARLSWGEKCLRAGQFCKVGNPEYRRYGFYCPRSGHLRRR
jgi:hypothetical protein